MRRISNGRQGGSQAAGRPGGRKLLLEKRHVTRLLPKRVLYATGRRVTATILPPDPPFPPSVSQPSEYGKRYFGSDADGMRGYEFYQVAMAGVQRHD